MYKLRFKNKKKYTFSAQLKWSVPETFECILPELTVLNFTQQFNTLVENL